MSTWETLLTVLRSEADAAVAEHVEKRLRLELAGMRITVPSPGRARISDNDLRRTLRMCGWNVDKAAAKLGIHRSSIYRRLAPQRATKRAASFFAERLVR